MSQQTTAENICRSGKNCLFCMHGVHCNVTITVHYILTQAVKYVVN